MADAVEWNWGIHVEVEDWESKRAGRRHVEGNRLQPTEPTVGPCPQWRVGRVICKASETLTLWNVAIG